MNEAVYPLYLPVFGSTRIAVPVLPAIRYPGIAAVGAVPLAVTTLSIINRICSAVAWLITRLPWMDFAGV